MLYWPNFFWNVLQVWMTGKDVYLQMTWSWPDKTWNILCSYCLQWSQSKFRNHYFLFLFAFSILSQLFLIWGCKFKTLRPTETLVNSNRVVLSSKDLLVWPERRPARESWGSHRRRQRSWEPARGGWGVWAASHSYWCQKHPGRRLESWLSCL